MEKLTEKKSFLSYHSLQPVNVVKIGTEEEFKVETMNDIYLVGSAIDKLAEYEDAEEQGLLLRLPCKVGDTVYCLMSAKTKIVETSILWIEKHSNCLVFALAGGFGDVVSENLGKTWFFTKEEAEQALAKVKEV